MRKRKMKNLPLQVAAIGVNADELRDITKDFDARVEKMSCCERAALRVGLVMAQCGMDLKDVVELQQALNHLIGPNDKGGYSVSKALMKVMKEKGN